MHKLIEEMEEFKVTPNEEELADILEVIDGIAHAFNLDMDKVLKVKADKLEKRGGFKERIVLEKVVEKFLWSNIEGSLLHEESPS